MSDNQDLPESAFSPEPAAPPSEILTHTPLKHTGLGITSFVISIIGIIAGIGLFIAAGAALASIVGNISDPAAIDEQALQDIIESSPVALMGIGIGFIAVLLLHLIGAIIGVISLFQKHRKKVFGVLGTVFNILVVAGVGLLVLIGIVIGRGMV